MKVAIQLALVSVLAISDLGFARDLNEKDYQEMVSDMKTIQVGPDGTYPVDKLDWLRASCFAVARKWAAQTGTPVNSDREKTYGSSAEAEICRQVDQQSILR